MWGDCSPSPFPAYLHSDIYRGRKQNRTVILRRSRWAEKVDPGKWGLGGWTGSTWSVPWLGQGPACACLHLLEKAEQRSNGQTSLPSGGTRPGTEEETVYVRVEPRASRIRYCLLCILGQSTWKLAIILSVSKMINYQPDIRENFSIFCLWKFGNPQPHWKRAHITAEWTRSLAASCTYWMVSLGNFNENNDW